MSEESLDFRLSHILRVFFVVKANILQNPTDTGFFSITGILMKAKDFTHLFHQANGFGHELPCWLIHISTSLYNSSFARYFPNMRKSERIYY